MMQGRKLRTNYFWDPCRRNRLLVLQFDTKFLARIAELKYLISGSRFHASNNEVWWETCSSRCCCSECEDRTSVNCFTAGQPITALFSETFIEIHLRHEFVHVMWKWGGSVFRYPSANKCRPIRANKSVRNIWCPATFSTTCFDFNAAKSRLDPSRLFKFDWLPHVLVWKDSLD